ncbi:MAG: sulfurtransferase [Candidatus Microbacterium phytovorans]|uniref:Sulfurtransferase n=1 Tax=Candidatus Microbacterium phytovorans TaxID=3121374 RepID=A0AAJ5VYX8_9MICO|nr:sulfurtransferase [Microbacterium sp.]WEK12702.1 MAG: sulfurtransferase [Microbacterium sp.]
MSSPLVAAARLHAELESAAPPRLLDVRWRLNEPEGRPAYLEGHLPGAVYVDLERELARPGRPEEGRYPLPERAELESSARRWGLQPGERVVAYDDNDGVAAARAWWLLRGYGVDIRVLDGGFRTWLAAGYDLVRGDHAPPPGSVRLPASTLAVATIQDAAVAPREGVLLDVRAPQHYRGQVAGLDPGAGHIPGAVNVPTVSHIAPDGRLHAPERLRAALAGHGIRPGVSVVLYCNNGIASAHSALALAVAGIDARVYPGAWSQWTRSPGRPIARGATPAEVISAV